MRNSKRSRGQARVAGIEERRKSTTCFSDRDIKMGIQ